MLSITTNCILLIILALVYNLYIILKYKQIPVSLSETSYMLGGLKRYWFTIYCVATVFLALPCLLIVVPESLTFLSFLMCGGMLFAGASPLFKGGLDKLVHYTTSIFSFVIFLIFIILVMGWSYLLIYLVLLGLLVLWKKECCVYFAEMLIYIFIIIFIL